jgi:hypothetical protein
VKTSVEVSQPRLILFATGAVSILLGVLHFTHRADLVANAVTRAAHDLNGLSMLFAGVVTVAVAWMAVSEKLVAGYAALSGVYFAAYAWILFFAGISWSRAAICVGIAVAALFAASNAWVGRNKLPEAL